MGGGANLHHYNAALAGKALSSPGERKERPMQVQEVTKMPTTLNTEPEPEKADALTVTDHRTGRVYEIPITEGTIRAIDLRQIKVDAQDFGLMSYDPAFMNTASCKSRITFIDGEKGILRYRGYPIEQLAEKSSYLEVAYLLLNGELPTAKQLADWQHEITYHTILNENMKSLLDAFRYDAHPMGRFISSMGALGTFYPE